MSIGIANKQVVLLSANQFKVPYPVYPIGISYLATYLREKLPTHRVSLIDCNLVSLEELKAKVKEISPDYVGVSLRNIDDSDSYHQASFIQHYKSLIDSVKSVSEAKIILGGSGYSIFYKELYKELGADYGVVGEGEESLTQLIQALDNNTSVENIQSLVYEKDGEVVFNDKKDYSCALRFAFDPHLLKYYWKESGLINIQTKRGCPYKCVYCSYPSIEGRKVRMLDQDLIIDSLKKIQKENQGDHVFFTDSVFNLNAEYNRVLAEKIIENGIKIKWMAYFSPFNITKEDLELFKKSGLTHIEFGTDSLSDAQLKRYGKKFNVDEIVRVSELCDEVGIHFAHFLILGGVGETDETIRETLENSKRFPRTVFFPFVGMRIFPNTPLYNIALEEGVITKDTSLLTPKYYISDKVDLSNIQELAKATGRKWVFPTEMDEISENMKFLRERNKKGPLWELITQ
ncbi:lipid biosynthesis B12-binding/radical SAM protein [Flammeovirga aprica]|uniref:Radical SAM protein n=1 Tax=Flammeovirga aprica JL-4 TaxID=694437 RepID=A0A7X9NZ91_9BACT|nr:lipid biosynthesis B12-binding/radical SAM protein [Flammeovirga aprica]NME66520.1 radical SAM protein [Flammeovirga aprica JL-4]